MTDPTSLSPAAQAVLDAYADVATRKIMVGRYVEEAIAAALRAAADQVVPEWPDSTAKTSSILVTIRWARSTIRDDFLAIAAELEGVTG